MNGLIRNEAFDKVSHPEFQEINLIEDNHAATLTLDL